MKRHNTVTFFFQWYDLNGKVKHEQSKAKHLKLPLLIAREIALGTVSEYRNVLSHNMRHSLLYVEGHFHNLINKLLNEYLSDSVNKN